MTALASDRPCLTVARTSHPPTIDGVISPGEWDNAARIGGLLTYGAQAVAQPGSTVFLTYDDRALYVAVICAEPDPTRPHGFVRAHDDRVFEDDCVQVFVAPEDLRKTKQASINFGGYEGAYGTWFADISAYYEFTVNGQGSITEARNDVRDWDAPWTARVSRTKGSWTAEIAIPFASLGITAPPDGALWGFNIFRLRHPDMSAWEASGFGGYTPLSLGAILLAGDHAVARQAAVAPAQIGPGSVSFTVVNPGGKAVDVNAGADPVSVPAHGTAELHAAYNLAGEGGLRGRYEVKVAGEDIPLVSGFVPLYVPPSCDLDLHYYSIPATVQGRVSLGPSTKTARAVLTLQPASGPAVTKEAALGHDRGALLTLPVAGEVGSRYAATLQILDDAGKPMAERKLDLTVPPKPAWLGTKERMHPGVLPPWTPMKVQGKTITMLGKRLTFVDLAFPSAIESAGAEMLTSPMRIVVGSGGKPLVLKPRSWRIVEQAPDHAKIESVAAAGGIVLRITSNIEYDGFTWNEVTLSGKPGATVDRVALEIPMRKEDCRYVYEGHAQAAHALSPLGLRRPMGDNLWVGGEDRGIAFLAESMEWSIAHDQEHQVEVVPAGKSPSTGSGPGGWMWRSTLIDSPQSLTSPYTARFALHITPAKPVSLRKSRIFHGAYYGLESAPSSASIAIPAKGHIDLSHGTLEFWVKPTFDVDQVYDPKVDRSVYNRQFFAVNSDASEALMLYYNADDRSFRAVTHNAAGQYPVILSGPAKLATGQWNYVAMSWGDPSTGSGPGGKLRLSINGHVAEQPMAAPVRGGIELSSINLALGGFDIDELRISSTERSLEQVPDAPFVTDAQTLLLDHCEVAGMNDHLVAGKFGQARGGSGDLEIDRLAREGKRIVIFHENWSRFQGYPDLAQVPQLRKIADACHKRGMIFLVYFNQDFSTACPEWPLMKDDILRQPEELNYHRDDVVQDCYLACVNGPYGDLLLDGIAKLADQAGIDGVYMDGTTVPWLCANPSHDGCGEYVGDGIIRPHVTLRATREFMKRLRSIFADRRKLFFLDAHTGGCINIATQSFCDGYFDGETLARYKPGFRLSPDTFLTGYMGKQFGFRGEFLPNRHSMDQALAISLPHDTATRGEPAEVDLAWGPYEGADTRFVPYWEKSGLYAIKPAAILGSLYLKRESALLVLGSQSEQTQTCQVEVAALLKMLPAGVKAVNAITGEAVPMSAGKLSFPIGARDWRMIEIRK